jgi:hypothetical protein
VGQVKEKVVEGNDPRRGHGLGNEGEWSHVEGKHGMAEV